MKGKRLRRTEGRALGIMGVLFDTSSNLLFKQDLDPCRAREKEPAAGFILK